MGPGKRVLGGVHIGATWRIRFNRSCAAAMRHCCQILFDHLFKVTALLQKEPLRTTEGTTEGGCRKCGTGRCRTTAVMVTMLRTKRPDVFYWPPILILMIFSTQFSLHFVAGMEATSTGCVLLEYDKAMGNWVITR